jgi:asparagine synthase (glutamine-hydrolysing)
MCGIFGGVGVTTDQARICVEAIRRGNDGISVRQHGDVVMAARRHLVKKSAKPNVPEGESDQPYVSDDGRIQLVFNGELYTFAEIRKDLIAEGASFETEGDTEVFLRLYESEGKDFVKNAKIDSLFSLAIHDQNTNELIITRDWPGRIPLFYYYDPENRVFLFSSELKGMRELDWVPLDDAIELTPGDLAILDLETFELKIEPYFRPTPRLNKEAPILEVGQELHRLLRRSAANRTMGDVPICTMFSGGIDSLLTSFYVLDSIDFSRVDYRPTGYVYAVEGSVSEDVRRAKAAAKGFEAIGFELKEIRSTGEQLVEDIPDIVTTFETRRIKALSVYPLPIYYYLAPVMHEDGFKVTIGGHGVDELIGAYDAWKELKASHKVQTNVRSRLKFMSSIYENMLRRASIIFMNKGPIEARFPFLQPDVCEFMLGIDRKWLSISPENAEIMLRLIDDRAGPGEQWPEQLSNIHAYLNQYLNHNGEHPEDEDPYVVSEMEKLFWKFPMIVAGMQAAEESFLPVWTLFNSKLRGQHGSGISDLEPKILDRYRHVGETDGEIFQTIVNQSFRLNPAHPDTA